MNKNKNLAFTLAEVLIVIGIIGVVAALTLPNLNHATGDKETVTRLQKAYSILNEANDRAVAIYGPISTWASNEECANDFTLCYMRRIKEFLKISKYCNEAVDFDSDEYHNCENFGYIDGSNNIIYELSDGITFDFVSDGDMNCSSSKGYKGWSLVTDVCGGFFVDVNGTRKGKGEGGFDQFRFMLTNSLGIIPLKDDENLEDEVNFCMDSKSADECTWWVLEFGNLDYLKADENGKCNDSNIILDGVTNTSCH